MADRTAAGSDPGLAFVIAHYHPQGKLAADLFALIRHLSALASRVVLVSTCLSAVCTAKVRPFAQVIARENFGYDFWSYRVGLEALGGPARL
jgi:rhamnosyltransferase